MLFQRQTRKLKDLREHVRWYLYSKVPHDRLKLFLIGHRAYVGGAWDQIGELQADFLRNAGLEPNHVLLDVGCGALRCGVRIIPYLYPGNYLGLDRLPRLIHLGIRYELGRELYEYKAPEFVVSTTFQFEKFTKRPDFAIAQSLFTHLREQDILTCLVKLRCFAKRGTRFFATYFVTERPRSRGKSNPLRAFSYTRDQTEHFGIRAGWKANYIGEWGHPRNQMMVEYYVD